MLCAPGLYPASQKRILITNTFAYCTASMNRFHLACPRYSPPLFPANIPFPTSHALLPSVGRYGGIAAGQLTVCLQLALDKNETYLTNQQHGSQRRRSNCCGRRSNFSAMPDSSRPDDAPHLVGQASSNPSSSSAASAYCVQQASQPRPRPRPPEQSSITFGPMRKCGGSLSRTHGKCGRLVHQLAAQWARRNRCARATPVTY